MLPYFYAIFCGITLPETADRFNPNAYHAEKKGEGKTGK
jgi:hypothetical protein